MFTGNDSLGPLRRLRSASPPGGVRSRVPIGRLVTGVVLFMVTMMCAVVLMVSLLTLWYVIPVYARSFFVTVLALWWVFPRLVRWTRVEWAVIRGRGPVQAGSVRSRSAVRAERGGDDRGEGAGS